MSTYATKYRLRSSRYILEPFAEKPIDNLASVSFFTEFEANRGVSGGASHNSVHFVMVEKLQKSPTDHLCNALNSALGLNKPQFANDAGQWAVNVLIKQRNICRGTLTNWQGDVPNGE